MFFGTNTGDFLSMASILVIDDSVSVLRTIEAMLSNDHEVTVSDSGPSGIKALRTRAFDLVITDIYMPDEDGLQVIRKARFIRPETPVIAMSGITGHMDMLRVAKCLGACQTLRKPCSKDALLEAVGLALASAGGGECAPRGEQA
jgi:DNA-binding NtrC family response regulator